MANNKLTEPIGSFELAFDARSKKKPNKGDILEPEPRWAEVSCSNRGKHPIRITDIKPCENACLKNNQPNDIYTQKENWPFSFIRKNIRMHWGGPEGSQGCATSPDRTLDKDAFVKHIKSQIPSLSSKQERTFILIPGTMCTEKTPYYK